MTVRFVTPGMRLLRFDRRLLVFSVVLSLAYLLIVMSRFLGLDVVLGLVCLSVVSFLIDLKVSLW